MIYYRDKAIVLTYHNISKEFTNEITISPKRLKSDLEMLINNGFNIITLNEMIDAINGERKLPDNAIAITFDDGLKSLFNYAFPILKDYNLPATCFIITSRCANYINLTNNASYLNKDLIKEMSKNKIFDFQSHTHSCHTVFKDRLNIVRSALNYRLYDINKRSYESKQNYYKRIMEDFRITKEIIYEITGKYPEMLCFPFGKYNRQVINIAKNCGFNYFISCNYGYNTYNSKEEIIKRVNVGVPYFTSDDIKNNIVECANKVVQGNINSKFRSFKRKVNNFRSFYL